MFRHFQFLGQTIHLFNLFLALAMMVGALELQRIYRSFSTSPLDEHKYNLTTVLAILTGIAGAMFFESIFLKTPLSLNHFIYSYKGGVTFYGGIIVGGITCMLLSVILRFNLFHFFNLAASSLTIGHAIGRIGCFFAGCCYGKPTQWLFGVIYPQESLPAIAFGKIPLHPTQLYESILLLFLFILLVTKVPLHYRASTYFIAYGFFRFNLEFFRADPRGTFLPNIDFSPSQVISIFLMVIGLLMFTKGLTKKVPSTT